MMTYQFLQTVALWCTVSLSGGLRQTIEHCRRQALKCAALTNPNPGSPWDVELAKAECISKVVLEIK